MKKTLFKQTGGDFIDPEDCGSFIRYAFHVTEFPPGGKDGLPWINDGFTMSLGDCSRVISWGFDDPETAIDKIEAVIRIMCKAREDLVAGLRISQDAKARVKKLEDASKAKKRKGAK